MQYTSLPKVLFQNETSNGDSDSILLVTGRAGGKKQLQVNGVFGGATLIVQTASEEDPTGFKTLTNGTLTDPTDLLLDVLKTGTIFKLNLASVSGTTDITAILR